MERGHRHSKATLAVLIPCCIFIVEARAAMLCPAKGPAGRLFAEIRGLQGRGASPAPVKVYFHRMSLILAPALSAERSPSLAINGFLSDRGICRLADGTFGRDAVVSCEAFACIAAINAPLRQNSVRGTNSVATRDGRYLRGFAKIPGALCGYKRIALDRGLFEAYPAEARQIAPGDIVAAMRGEEI